MAIVWIPSLLRDLSGGRDRVAVEGRTLGQVIENLERACPGIKAWLLGPDGQIEPHIMAAVDGEEAIQGLRTPVGPESEIHFLPAISGGAPTADRGGGLAR